VKVKAHKAVPRGGRSLCQQHNAIVNVTRTAQGCPPNTGCARRGFCRQDRLGFRLALEGPANTPNLRWWVGGVGVLWGVGGVALPVPTRSTMPPGASWKQKAGGGQTEREPRALALGACAWPPRPRTPVSDGRPVRRDSHRPEAFRHREDGVNKTGRTRHRQGWRRKTPEVVLGGRKRRNGGGVGEGYE
jgi:hypothetical protein